MASTADRPACPHWQPCAAHACDETCAAEVRGVPALSGKEGWRKGTIGDLLAQEDQ